MGRLGRDVPFLVLQFLLRDKKIRFREDGDDADAESGTGTTGLGFGQLSPQDRSSIIASTTGHALRGVLVSPPPASFSVLGVLF